MLCNLGDVIPMRYMCSELKDMLDRYTKDYPDIDELSFPLMNVSDILRAYFILADYFTDNTANEEAEKMLIGIRDMNLLISALGRQKASFSGVNKYSQPLDICATLFFGLVKNHAFSDGNKRTALLTLLYQLDCYGYCPNVSNKKFEHLVVNVACNNLEHAYEKQWKNVDRRYRADKTDISIGVISQLLKKMTKKKDNSYHINVSARDFINAINSLPDCSATVDGSKIKLQRNSQVKPKLVFFKQPDKVINYSIPYRGDTRPIGAGTARDVLNKLELYDQYPDYASFFQGADPRYMLIEMFEAPLRRLKDK